MQWFDICTSVAGIEQVVKVQVQTNRWQFVAINSAESVLVRLCGWRL